MTKESAIKRIPIIVRSEAKLAPKISAKLIEFAKWDKIEEVNSMLDNGDNPNSVYKWVKEQGFSISVVWLGEYAKLRKKALVDGVSMEHILGIAGKPMFDTNDVSTKSTKDKLKSEIDALDMIIQKGYTTLKNIKNNDITPKVLMAAIKLKNELTDGNHGFLTNFGMEHLRDIENAKYALIMQHLLSYIPEDKREEAVSQIADIEDKYYQTTDYYEEYLRASGELTEDQIDKKLQLWYETRQTTLV